MYKIFKALFLGLFIVLFPIILLFTDVQIAAFDRDFYASEFKKYNITENLDISFDNLMAANENTINYIEGKRVNLDFQVMIAGAEQEFFSKNDKLHMVDVKDLFDKGSVIRNLSLIYVIFFIIIGFYKNKGFGRSLAKYCLISSLMFIGFIGVLAILMNIDFYKYFTIFHKIFFTNDLWLMDPLADRLVNIYPEGFFTDIAFRISSLFAIELALIISVSSIILKKSRS